MSLLLALFLSAQVFAQNYQSKFSEFKVSIAPDFSSSLHGFYSNDPLTPESLERDAKAFSSSHDFISYLQRRAPELLTRPVLMHSSGSIQYADPMHPRLFLFGRGAVFALDGRSPTSPVEMMFFNPETLKFEMTEITFASAGRASAGGASAGGASAGRGIEGAKVNRNPSACVACHGVDSKPIWAPYDFWPNAYGSLSGFFSSKAEETSFNQFLSQREQNEIYRHLEIQTTGGKMDALDSFTQYISSLNNLRTFGIWKGDERLKPFRYVLAAGLNGCTSEDSKTFRPKYLPVEEYLPPSLRSQMAAPPVFYEEDGTAARGEFVQLMSGRYGEYFPGERPKTFLEISGRLDFEIKSIAHTRWILEGLGYSWRDFVAAQGDNNFTMAIPGLTLFDMSAQFAVFDPRILKEMRPNIERQAGLDWPIYDCVKLKKESLKALKDVSLDRIAPSPLSRADTTRGLAPMSRCVKCHVVSPPPNEFVPFIPFHDNRAFARWMKTGRNKAKLFEMVDSGKMPKNSSLSAREKDALKEAFLKIEAL